MPAELWMAVAALGMAADVPGPMWVMLSDKGFDAAAESAAIAGLERAFPARAVERRRLRRTEPGLFDARDLPVSAEYVARIEAAGLRVRARSRWLNAVSVEGPTDAIGRARLLPFVRAVRPVARGTRRATQETTMPRPDFGGRDFYGSASAQLGQINLAALHARGATGEGVVVGVLDTGFVTTHTAFNHPDKPLHVIAARDFINDDGNVGIEAGDHPDQHRHGTWILGCLAAYWPDVLVGGAPDARYILCKTEDVASETPVEEDYYVEGLEFAEFHGADVATSSLGYIDWYTQADLDGATAVTTIAVNIATANGVHCCTAAGNEGHDGNPNTSTLIAPADATRVITCGAVDAAGSIAGFSSSGPTADGRVKPEVLARGVETFTVSSRSDVDLGRVSGTSLSTPLVAAAVACITQRRPAWTPDQMRSALMSTASDFVATGRPDPLFVRGYGILDADAAAGECQADFNGDGFVDFFDFDGFVACFEGGPCPPGRSADYNGDGFADFFDYDGFVAAFEAGC